MHLEVRVRLAFATLFVAGLFAVPFLSGAAPTVPSPPRKVVRLYSWPLAVSTPVTLSYAKLPSGTAVTLKCFLKAGKQLLGQSV
jgi:hypothetical protein